MLLNLRLKKTKRSYYSYHQNELKDWEWILKNIDKYEMNVDSTGDVQCVFSDYKKEEEMREKKESIKNFIVPCYYIIQHRKRIKNSNNDFYKKITIKYIESRIAEYTVKII